MGMKIAEHTRPAAPRGTMRINQYLRIDLEMALGRSVDVAGYHRRGDPPGLAQQDAAGLARMGSAGRSAHGFEGSACHVDVHGAWP